MAGSEAKHTWLQKRIYERPDIVGIDESSLISKATEYAMYRCGHIFVCPDIYLLTNQGHHFLEVKSGSSQFLFSKGMSQLEKILQCAGDMGIDDADARLVMPRADYQGSKYWVDMLNNLTEYRAGDSYIPPYKT